MARSRRGRGRRSSTRRNVDWVVNDYSYEFTPPYDIPVNANVFIPLTVPKFAVSYTDPSFGVQQPAYYLPEQDGGQVAYAVRGDVFAQPTTWISGNQWNIMMRIAKFPVEYATGYNAIVDPAYSLILSQFANERFLWQKLYCNIYGMSGELETLHIDWKGVCKIEPNEALFLVVENISNGIIRTILRPFLRTLMRADG